MVDTTSARYQDFTNRAKTSDGRAMLLALRDGEIKAMSANGALYQEDKRRKWAYRAWEENSTWVAEINRALDFNGYWLHQFTHRERYDIILKNYEGTK
jgi:hypothetical protein